jgi:hypothetical protein
MIVMWIFRLHMYSLIPQVALKDQYVATLLLLLLLNYCFDSNVTLPYY